jgi:hypothetical protein
MHKEYRQEWENAGYSSKMGSAEVCRPPLGRLQRVYHVTSAHHAISNIALSRLKVARLSDVNDPFELLALNLRDKSARELLRKIRTEFDKTTGLLCFSGNWTSPALWSHYGDKHSGVCLGFDVPRERLEQVEYKDERIARIVDHPFSTAVPSIDDLPADLQEQLKRTKFSHWSYEEEWRWFVRLSDMSPRGRLYFKQFDPDLRLREVILGVTCELDLDEVRRLTLDRAPDALVIRTRMAWGHFAVVPLESTVP